MSGTFIIRGATSISSKSAPAGTWGGGTIGYDPARPIDNTSLLAGINSLADQSPSLYAGWVSDISPIGTWICRFGFGLSDAVIALDGNSPISYFSLPSGIRILTATLGIGVARYPNVLGDGSGHLYFQRNLLTESADLGQNVSLSQTAVTKTFVYDFTPTGFGTFLDAINDGFGIRIVFSGTGFGQYFDKASISGTYDILSYTFSFPLNGTSIDLQKNRVITVTSDPLDPNAMDLTHITVALGACAITIVTQTTNLLVFSIPDSCSGDGVVSVVATGDGFQFSGPVSLGSITILTTNASGIYVLTSGKTSDTLYSSLRDGTTYDVKIPDPFAKTGFIGG